MKPAVDSPSLDAARDARAAGHLLAAVEQFERVISTNPDEGDAHVELVQTLRELRLTRRARLCLERAASQWPSRWDICLEQARLASIEGDSRTALECYERVIQLTPETVWAEPYVGAADQLRQLRRFPEAEDLLSRALALCAGHNLQEHLLLRAKALVLVAARRASDAVPILRRLISDVDNHEVAWEAAQLLSAELEFSAARELLAALGQIVHKRGLDTLTYARYAESVGRAADLASEIDRTCRTRPTCNRVTLSPRSAARERPAAWIRAKRWEPAPVTRYFLPSHAPPPAPPLPITALPKDLRAQGESFFRWPAFLQERLHFTYALRRAIVFDNLGLDSQSLVILSDGGYVPELTTAHAPAALGRLAMVDRRRLGEDAIPEAFVLPSIGGWYNHYHSLIDILSALAIYSRLQLSCPIITPGPLDPQRRAVFAAAGIPEAIPVIAARDISGRLLDRAICPERVRGHLLREWCTSLVANTVSNEPPGRGEAPRVVYVSRRRSSSRRLTNEEALEGALARNFGAAIVFMEELTFESQLRIASAASLLIGPHGAGLANVAFMKPGTWLLELLPRTYAVGVYRALATEVGVGYFPIAGDVSDVAALEWDVNIPDVLRATQAFLDALA